MEGEKEGLASKKQNQGGNDRRLYRPKERARHEWGSAGWRRGGTYELVSYNLNACFQNKSY
eukprot:766026-Hanusia_phi.AAC.3